MEIFYQISFEVEFNHEKEMKFAYCKDHEEAVLQSRDELPERKVKALAICRLITVFVPMLNPDGVILGNSRCGALGKDLNR